MRGPLLFLVLEGAIYCFLFLSSYSSALCSATYAHSNTKKGRLDRLLLARAARARSLLLLCVTHTRAVEGDNGC